MRSAHLAKPNRPEDEKADEWLSGSESHDIKPEREPRLSIAKGWAARRFLRCAKEIFSNIGRKKRVNPWQ